MRLAAGHFRMRTSSNALDPRVLLATEAWTAGERVTTRPFYQRPWCVRTVRSPTTAYGEG
jgi:hypothetical protein